MSEDDKAEVHGNEAGSNGNEAGEGTMILESQPVPMHFHGNRRDNGVKDHKDDAETSEDTFEGYRKKIARKLGLKKKHQIKIKFPPPEHLTDDTDDDKTKDDTVDPTSPVLSTALLADCRYDMSHSRRGRALLINNEDFEEDVGLPRRLSTEADVDGLGRVLQDLGFLVQLFQNLTCGQMKKLVHLLSTEDHGDADCILVAVMTHGNNGEIYGTDGPMSALEISAPFRGDTCRSLIGKPKLFIFQACRGDLVDQGVAIDSHDVDETDALIGYAAARTIPVEADFLTAYSSPQGYASWRNATWGAWFIQSLVRAFDAYGTSWEITRVLTLVNRMVALQYESLSQNTFMTRKKQMPCFVSTLTKELHFTPKRALSRQTLTLK